MATVQAEPYEFAFAPSTTALVIIDMQRDFVDAGGFGEALGNDVSLLRKAIAPTKRVLDAARERGSPRHPHARGPPPRPRRPAGGEEAARPPQDRHRRSRANGPHPRPRRVRPRHHRRAQARARRAGRRQARQGRLLRHRPRLDAAQPRHPEPRRVRRHDRGVRQHHGARSERPRVRLPRARGLRRVLLPRVPGGRARDDQGAGRDLRLGERLGAFSGSAGQGHRNDNHQGAT